MNKIDLKTDENGRKAFRIFENADEELGRMEIGIKDGLMTVYHTEVSPQSEGKGLARELLNHMVEYARKENLQVKPLCKFVHTQFKRRPEDFRDIWTEEQEN